MITNINSLENTPVMEELSGSQHKNKNMQFFFFSIIIWIHVLTNNIQANKNIQTKQILTYIKQRQYKYNTLTIWRAN